MRLIDADALKEEIEFHPTSVSVCMTVEQARGETNFKLRCLEDIDNAPTIDAIPVKWMCGLMDAFVTTGDTNMQEYALLLTNIIEAWQKEQEAR